MKFPVGPGKYKKTVAFWQRPSIFYLSGAGLLLLGVLAGFYLFFPEQALKQRIIQEVEAKTKAEVRIGQLTLFPLLTLDANRVKLDLAGLPQPLEIDLLSLAPQWSTLMSGDPGVQIEGNVMNGAIKASFQKSGAVTAVVSGLQLDLPLQKPLPFNLTGTLSDGTFSGGARLDSDTATHLLLRFANVTLHGLDILKADGRGVSLGEITLEIEGQGRSMRLKTLTARGGDLDVSAEGTLLIGRTAATSRIKLKLLVLAGANAGPSLSSLLQLAGTPDDDGRYTLLLTGTMAQPNLKPGG